MADKKFQHVTLVIAEEVFSDLATAMSIRSLSGSAGGMVDAFVAKLVSEVKQGHDMVRYEYKDKTRGQ